MLMAWALASCTSDPPRRVTVALGQTCDEMEAIEPGLGAFCESADPQRKVESIAFRLIDPKARRTLVAVNKAAVTLETRKGRVHAVRLHADARHGTAAERRADARAVIGGLGPSWSCEPRAFFDAIARPDGLELEEWTEGEGLAAEGFSDCRALRAASPARLGTCTRPSGSSLTLSVSCDPVFSWRLGVP